MLLTVLGVWGTLVEENKDLCSLGAYITVREINWIKKKITSEVLLHSMLGSYKFYKDKLKIV